MSLSARIAIGPSTRLARLAAVVGTGGVAAATACGAARWPGSAWLAVLAGIVASSLFILRMRALGARSHGHRLAVSRHVEIDVDPSPREGVDGSWRLVEGTMAWPGFSMLALAPCDPFDRSLAVHAPAFDADLSIDDRWALRRFLQWTLRGGDGSATRADGR